MAADLVASSAESLLHRCETAVQDILDQLRCQDSTRPGQLVEERKKVALSLEKLAKQVRVQLQQPSDALQASTRHAQWVADLVQMHFRDVFGSARAVPGADGATPAAVIHHEVLKYLMEQGYENLRPLTVAEAVKCTLRDNEWTLKAKGVRLYHQGSKFLYLPHCQDADAEAPIKQESETVVAPRARAHPELPKGQQGPQIHEEQIEGEPAFTFPGVYTQAVARSQAAHAQAAMLRARAEEQEEEQEMKEEEEEDGEGRDALALQGRDPPTAMLRQRPAAALALEWHAGSSIAKRRRLNGKQAG